MKLTLVQVAQWWVILEEIRGLIKYLFGDTLL